MNIPAYTSPTLCLGRTFDTESSSACADIFPSATDMPTKLINVNKFSFKYKVVKSSKDVNDLLDVSGELSLKIKANLLKVEGAGQYINENKMEEGTSNLLAVMKCTTAIETIDGSVKPRDDVTSGEFLEGVGTHYVRSVTYGVEMVASLKFKSSSTTKKEHITGNVDGQLNLQGVDAGLKASLDKLSSECSDVSDISIKYYATDLPDKLPTTLEGLVTLIETFPSRLKNINDGKGIPMQFELQPVKNIIPTAKAYLQKQALTYQLEELESRFDDLRSAQTLANAYLQSVEETDDDVKKFISKTNKIYRVFRSTISTLNTKEGEERMDACMEAYEDAFDGHDILGKFVLQWKKILSSKAPIATIKLPQGDPLTVVLLGKTGNGKSATGNSIIGRECFADSPSGGSVTVYCRIEKRTDERVIGVIDTPGIMDTAPVSAMGKLKEKAKEVTGLFNEKQEEILRELYKMFAMSPDGIDAIILTIKYGGRFGLEDAEALKILQQFFGKEANDYMVVIFTHGDQAVRDAKKKKRSIPDHLKWYIGTLPDWVQAFLKEIGDRRLLFNNALDEEENPDDCKKQVSDLIQIIEELKKGKGSFIHRLTKASKSVLDEEIKKAMDESGLTKQAEALRKKEEELKKQLDDKRKSDAEREKLEKELEEEKRKQEELEEQKKKLEEEKKEPKKRLLKVHRVEPQQRQRMDSLKIGEEVQVIAFNEIRFEPVITFIHHQLEVMQEFLEITTMKNNILKITEDHLMFVEKTGQAAAIPARDVKVGDTVYVKGKHGIEKDAVQSISSVYEKGVYAPVTLSGTILVNNVHTSCYFDVLSHEWSHRAMGVARAVHYVSPWMLRWISGVGQKDGFPGWCRLAHKMLTLLD
ncbi:hypothetical protein ACROYT_G008280 [Oculina patagonica]